MYTNESAEEVLKSRYSSGIGKTVQWYSEKSTPVTFRDKLSTNYKVEVEAPLTAAQMLCDNLEIHNKVIILFDALLVLVASSNSQNKELNALALLKPRQ